MESTDDHGRPLTTTPEASAWYRKAQQSADLHTTERALRKALECEPGFAVAAADLSVLVGAGPRPTATGMQAWERHHIEIVRSVEAGDRRRAVALLADHLSTLVCDPIATRIVAPEECDYGLPECHPAAWDSRAEDGSRQFPNTPIEGGPERAGDLWAPDERSRYILAIRRHDL
jgi:hypothetical protein